MSFERSKKELREYAISTTLMLITIKLLALIAIKIYTTVLSKAQFGLYSLILSQIGLLVAIAGLGIPGSALRFLSSIGEEEKGDSRKQIIYTSIISMSVTGVIVGISLVLLSFLFPDSFDVPNQNVLAILSGILVICGSLHQLNVSIIRSRSKSKYYVTYRLGHNALSVGMSAIFVIVARDIVAILLGTILGYLIVFFVYNSKLLHSLRKPTFSFRVMRKSLSFGLPFTVAGIISNLYSLIISTSLFIFISSESLAIYSAALSIGNLIMSLDLIVAATFPPVVYKANEAGDKVLSRVVSHTARLYLSLIICLGAIFSLSAELLVLVITSSSYIEAVIYLPPIIFGHLIILMTMACVGMIVKSKTHHYIWINILASIPGIFIAIFLISNFGIIGAVTTGIIRSCIMLLLFFVTSQRIVKIKFEYIKMTGAVISGILSFFIAASLTHQDILGNAILRSLVFLGFYGTALFVLQVVRLRDLKELFSN